MKLNFRMIVKISALILFLVFAAVFSLAAYFNIPVIPILKVIYRQATIGNAEYHIGRQAPEIVVSTFQNGSLDLADHIGKKMIVLNFFALECGPCRRELPEFQRFFQDNSLEVLLLGLSVDHSEKRDSLEALLAANSVTYPVALTDDQKLRDRFGLNMVPVTIIIGADGMIMDFIIGGIEKPYEKFSASLAKTRLQIASGQTVSRERFLEKAK